MSEDWKQPILGLARCWDDVKADWVPLTLATSATSEFVGTAPSCAFLHSPGQKLKVSTLNVLADCFPRVVEMCICSPQRIAALVEEISRLDATILGLNEVTPNILSHILASSFVRRNYCVTETPALVNQSLYIHGCVVLSKVPISRLQVQWPAPPESKNSRKVVFVAYDDPSDTKPPLIVASQHTVAYQNEKNYLMRKEQIAGTCQAVKDMAGGGENVPFILMGDLNFHYVCEDSTVLESDLCDLWAETHCDPETFSIEDGFTYDSQRNKMIPRYVPGENRRMRLDRILCSRAFLTRYVVTTPVSIWADQAIDVERELWISDHFGLSVDVQVVGPGVVPVPPKAATEKAIRVRAGLDLNESTYGMWNLLLSMPRHAVFLLMRVVRGSAL